MYLLKKISFDAMNKNVIVENGLKVGIRKNVLIYLPYSFWGETEINLGRYTDFSKLEKLDEDNCKYLLTYVNEYYIKPLEDNFKKFLFNVSVYQEDNVEGYIIFLEYADKIKTNGEKLFGRYYNEIVVVLKDKDFLEFEGKRIEVVNNNLVLLI